MNMPSKVYCLALHPQLSYFNRQELDRLQQYLFGLGLLGETFAVAGEPRYRLGDRFYQFLTFMGCAPALKLAPERPGDEQFCHFRFVENPQIVFRYLRPEVKARCPHCRKPGATAEEIRQGYFLAQLDWLCPHCQTRSPAHEINWKHEAGIGQFFLELIDVHPHEVMPTDSFLTGLETATGQHWDYFYTSI